jgi:uncharacterized protein (TIGR00375 family)
MVENDWMIGDLHLHSSYSRATSPSISFDNLVKWAKIKGLDLLGTGDFTHPEWLKEIREKLIEKNGLYYYQDFPFIISGEISLIYTQGTGRRIHLVILVPSLEIADKINSYLDTKGRRDYDGRPIFNISCEEFVNDLMSISGDIEIIPAHIWTPWFSLFGSMSGFDSLQEAFGKQSENIHAIETGMSSDPAMNWRIKELGDKAIVSFSDSHSFWPFRMGREATIFKKVGSYKEIIEQIKNNSFIATIETDPAYGKYHWDGHRNCGFSCSPSKSKEINNICPVCQRDLTIGVENRVFQLANFPEGYKVENAKQYYILLPLHEIIALAIGTNDLQGKKVWQVYNSLIEVFDNEFNILLKARKEELLKVIDEKLVDLILKNREGKISVQPGFDGQYGRAKLKESQESLSKFL